MNNGKRYRRYQIIKTIVRSAPGHLELGFRWPFNNQIVKFTSKDSKEKLAQDFEPILDGGI